MTKIIRYLAWTWALFSLAILAACGGGGDSDGDWRDPIPPVTPQTIYGVVSKGLLSGATVTVFELHYGVKRLLLAQGTTDDSGRYALELDHDGPVLVEATGGNYIDEATGRTLAFGDTLRAVLPPLSHNAQVAVTPLTELAVRMAESGIRITTERIKGANAFIAQLINADIITTLPANCNDHEAFAGSAIEAQDYALLLAAISQLASTSGLGILGVIDDIAADLDDAQLDATGNLLLTAIADYLVNPNNASGATEAPALEDCINNVIQNGMQSSHKIPSAYIQ